ncbi:MAG TPA: hypothetical protein VF257_07855 [Solirubrobacteraceae bacterium]
MRPHRYALLPDEDLQPTDPVPHVPVKRQAEAMRELRSMHNQIPNGYLKRDRQMQAWALSNSVSRRDIAVATGLVKSRVDQIIRDLTLADDARKAREAVERVRRHLPDDADLSMFSSEQPDVFGDDRYGEGMGETLT